MTADCVQPVGFVDLPPGEYNFSKYPMLPQTRKLVPHLHEQTLWSLLQRSCDDIYPHRRCLGFRPKHTDGSFGDYEWIRYSDVIARVRALRRSLHALGLRHGDRVVIYCRNSPIWTIVSFAVASLGAIAVPLYDTMGTAGTHHVLQDSRACLAVCGSDFAPKVLGAALLFPELRGVVVIDDAPTLSNHDRETLQAHALKYFAAPHTDNGWQTTGREFFHADSALSANDSVGPEAVQVACIDDLIAHSFVAFGSAADASLESLDGVLASDHEVPGLFLVPISALEARGAAAAPLDGTELTPLLPSDVSSIVYTSGSSGPPKGACLTNANLIYGCFAMLQRILLPSRRCPVDETDGGRYDVLISYLPLSHVFERAVELLSIINGSCIGYYSGSTSRLLADVAALRPTQMPAVPKILTRIYGSVQGNLDSASRLSRGVFNFGLGRTVRRREGRLTVPFETKLYGPVFKRLRAMLGGRLRTLWTGSAPCPPHVFRFLVAALDVVGYVGYGLSETASAGLITDLDDFSMDTIGSLLQFLDARVVDAPAKGYFVTPEAHDAHAAAEAANRGLPAPAPVNRKTFRGRGELLLRGQPIFCGYWGMPAEVSASDADGFFHTADLVQLEPGGRLTILGRDSGIIKLSQAEFLSLSAVEDNLERCELVESVFLHATPLDSYPAAAIRPSFPHLRSQLRLAAEAGTLGVTAAAVEATSDTALCLLPEVVAFVRTQLDLFSRRSGLRGFERPKALLLTEEEWNVDNGLLTPSSKKARKQLMDRFGAALDELLAPGRV
jgi:long-chain acyl-CoA synthetase